MPSANGPVYFIMGVSGCGKSTVGKLLAEARSLPFFDGDNFHPEANVRKMAAGQPLNDFDRKEWLLSLNTLAKDHQLNGAVIVCSALKASYRELLSRDIEDKVSWVLLDGSFQEILHRLKKRKGHFMPISLLESQFETLERPQAAIIISIHARPEEIVQEIIARIGDD